MDIVITYLKTISGGGRKGLIDSAKKRRDAVAPSAAALASAASEVAPDGVQADPTSAAQTASVEDVQEAEVPAVSGTAGGDAAVGEQEAEVKVDEEAERKYGVAKARAERLLKAMGAR